MDSPDSVTLRIISALPNMYRPALRSEALLAVPSALPTIALITLCGRRQAVTICTHISYDSSAAQPDDSLDFSSFGNEHPSETIISVSRDGKMQSATIDSSAAQPDDSLDFSSFGNEHPSETLISVSRDGKMQSAAISACTTMRYSGASDSAAIHLDIPFMDAGVEYVSATEPALLARGIGGLSIASETRMHTSLRLMKVVDYECLGKDMDHLLFPVLRGTFAQRTKLKAWSARHLRYLWDQMRS
jgi:hypothetical protein